MDLVELRNQNLKLKRLLDIASALNSSLGIEHLLPLIIISSRDFLDAAASSLFLLDKRHNILYCEVAIGERGRVIKQYLRLDIGEGIAGWVAKEGRALLIADAYKDHRFDKSWDEMSNFQTKSIICIPIYLKDELIGTLEVINKRNGNVFTEYDLELLEYLGHIVAVALDNARLYDGLQIKIKELSLLTEMEKKIASGWSVDQLLEWTLSKCTQILNAQGGSVLMGGAGKPLTMKCATGTMSKRMGSQPVLSDAGVVGISRKEKRAVLIKNIHTDKRFEKENLQIYESGTMLCAPFLSENDFYGVMIINDKAEGLSFTREDLNSLANVAERLSTLIRSASIFDQMKESSKEQQSARKLMEKIIPSVLPSFNGVDIYARYIPFNLIGGDFYRFIEFNDNKLGILVVDVSGHGLSAAMISVMVNTMIHTVPAEVLSSPGNFFSHLNNNLINRLGGNFLTAFYLVIDMNNHTLNYANGGHHDAILYSRGSGEFSVLNAAGPLLGVWNTAEFQEKTMPIVPQSRVVIYTDGLLEIVGEAEINILDESDIITAISNDMDLSPFQMSEKLISSVLTHSKAKEFNDDVTLLIIDFK